MSGNNQRIARPVIAHDAASEHHSRVLEALQGIRYGAVEITIHDGRIVQIERREKLRLDQAPVHR